jgi:hypothetical protein
MRIDKMGVILNYGQIPLIKSRYLEYINNEEQPYGVNAIVAIMAYTGYNVEDAILINEGSVARGIFRTTYFSMYEAKEESSKVNGLMNSKFANIQKNNVIKLKQGYDYSMLDDHGMIKEGTQLNDKIMLIGKINSNLENKDIWIDDSVKPKKGQLGYVDKSFITLGEEGFNVAKVRIREERVPAIGDKMASRAGQKGTLGLIIPEEDMPFTADGLRPDLIINPHALPSRMTIGQIVESLLGKVCTSYGAFGDCTAFQVKGSNYSTYAPLLVKAGYNSSGNQLLYNGMTGEQLQADIYIGPTYYMRLKHMVKDKINYRARGPNTALTKQPVQGRANDGGLRIGEMERDGVLAHGMSYFLNESFLVRGDEYYIAVCNKTGSLAIYNDARNLFLSPLADGPVQFATNADGTMNIKNVSRFGRSFSILRVPYSLKLLIQELQVMNVQLRIITDDNVDQLLSMSYSNNASKLMQITETDTDDLSTLEKAIILHDKTTKQILGKEVASKVVVPDEINEMPDQFKQQEIKPENILKITNAQKAYKLEPGEIPEMPELTPEMIENPTEFMYIQITMPDGSTQSKNRYPPPYDLIAMLSKNDQRWLIQQPFQIQHKILLEMRDKYARALLEQKRLFDEGKVKTPFVNLPPVSASLDTPTPNASPEWAQNSPAYVPNSYDYNSDSPVYASASPAYIANATSTDSSVFKPGAPYSPPYNPNATSTETDSSVYKPGPPYPQEPPKSDSILNVDEGKEKEEKEKEEENKKDESSENKKIIITKGDDTSSLSTNDADATKKISL